MDDPDYDEREVVNLDGVFDFHHHSGRETEGVQLRPFLTREDLHPVLVSDSGMVSRFKQEGSWFCTNKDCSELFGPLIGERELVVRGQEEPYIPQQNCSLCSLQMVFISMMP